MRSFAFIIAAISRNSALIALGHGGQGGQGILSPESIEVRVVYSQANARYYFSEKLYQIENGPNYVSDRRRRSTLTLSITSSYLKNNDLDGDIDLFNATILNGSLRPERLHERSPNLVVLHELYVDSVWIVQGNRNHTWTFSNSE